MSAYRKYKDRLNFEVHIEYIASLLLTGRTLVLTDPMLATGSSMELAWKACCRQRGSLRCAYCIYYSEPAGGEFYQREFARGEDDGLGRCY